MIYQFFENLQFPFTNVRNEETRISFPFRDIPSSFAFTVLSAAAAMRLAADAHRSIPVSVLYHRSSVINRGVSFRMRDRHKRTRAYSHVALAQM